MLMLGAFLVLRNSKDAVCSLSFLTALCHFLLHFVVVISYCTLSFLTALCQTFDRNINIPRQKFNSNNFYCAKPFDEIMFQSLAALKYPKKPYTEKPGFI